jgi:hypothetical protein
MGLGIRLRKLWHLKLWIAAGFLLACAAALWSVQKVSLFPPELSPRALEIASAKTQVVVDMPKSTILDLRQDTYSLEGLTNRAVLLGNVMASAPVRTSIAERAGVPVKSLQVTPPLTPEQPRATIEAETKRRTTDIIKTNDQYRLAIQANPTVPVLYIYTQTPSADTARDLANAAVDGLSAYLRDLAETQETPARKQLQLVQLGRAKAEVINEGADWQVALLAFLITFGASCAMVVFLSRVKRGWRLARLAERPAGG